MGTKKGRIYGKGVPQRFGGSVAPNYPTLEPPLNSGIAELNPEYRILFQIFKLPAMQQPLTLKTNYLWQ